MNKFTIPCRIVNSDISSVDLELIEIAEKITLTQGRIAQIINLFNVEQINNFYKQGKSINQIGEIFNINSQTVWSIINKQIDDKKKF